MNKIRRAITGALMLGIIGTAMLSLPTMVAAKSTDIIRTGSCSNASTWKLKAKPDNGRIEVEFQVDQNVNGQAWNVKLKDNGTVFFQGVRTTQAPSGSFSVTRRTINLAGTDLIVGRAVNQKSGEVCRGSLSF